MLLSTSVSSFGCVCSCSTASHKYGILRLQHEHTMLSKCVMCGPNVRSGVCYGLDMKSQVLKD